MVALSKEFEVSREDTQRFFARHHTYRSGAKRCSNPRRQSYLRHQIYDGCEQSEFCSRDPIGYLGKQENLYSYVTIRPLVFTDPTGLLWLGSPWGNGGPFGSEFPISGGGAGPTQADYPDVDFTSCPSGCMRCARIFQDWLNKEKARKDLKKKLRDLPGCPCSLTWKSRCSYISNNGVPHDIGDWELPADGNDWVWDKAKFPFIQPFVYIWTGTWDFHPGSQSCMRSGGGVGNKPEQQCCFDSKGKLVTHGPGAGTPDINDGGHGPGEVDPFNCALELDGGDIQNPGPNMKKYLMFRTPDNRNGCAKNP